MTMDDPEENLSMTKFRLQNKIAQDFNNHEKTNFELYHSIENSFGVMSRFEMAFARISAAIPHSILTS